MNNQILVGDFRERMEDVGVRTVDLIFADPPFNQGLKYDQHNDSQDKYAYQNMLADLFRWSWDVLKPTGALWLQCRWEMLPQLLSAAQTRLWHLRQMCVWHYTFGPHQRGKFTRSFQLLLHFVKDAERFTFNADAVRVPSQRQNAGDKRANPAGRIPDDVWTIPRVCGTFKEKSKHGPPCQTPEAIVERIIKVSSNPGELVLDPFLGTGTTAIVAERLGRNWIGIELSPAYAQAAEERIASQRKVVIA